LSIATSVAAIDASTGAAAGDEHRVGEAAEREIVGLFAEGARGERGGVLDVHVAEEGDALGAERAAEAQGLVGAALDQALIGDARAGVDVDPDEARARRDGDGQRGLGVVAEHVDPQRDPGRRGAHGERRGRHRGHGDRRDAARLEGRVAEVLHHDALEAGLREEPRVGRGRGEHGAEIAGEARARREWREVDDANQRREGDVRGSAHGAAELTPRGASMGTRKARRRITSDGGGSGLAWTPR